MPRLVNLDAPATLRAVNSALRALGFHSEQLELVRGQGYYYVAGTDDVLLAQPGFGNGEAGLYHMGPSLSAYSVLLWVGAVLARLLLCPDYELVAHPESAARLSAAVRTWRGWAEQGR